MLRPNQGCRMSCGPGFDASLPLRRHNAGASRRKPGKATKLRRKSYVSAIAPIQPQRGWAGARGRKPTGTAEPTAPALDTEKTSSPQAERDPVEPTCSFRRSTGQRNPPDYRPAANACRISGTCERLPGSLPQAPLPRRRERAGSLSPGRRTRRRLARDAARPRSPATARGPKPTIQSRAITT
jgi:hypothetical protein